jgi:nitroimidazol reductase NimA-like FMN-containing flavoprotein (pyridoxamine 5'-phosphate oxidase superfamily)
MTDDAIVTDRQGMEVLSDEECWQHIREAPIGRIAFMDAGEPLILPVNHVVFGKRIAFLTAQGSKLGAAMMAEPMGFEVDGFDVADRSGWSVVVKGTAEPVYDSSDLEELDAAGLEPWAEEIDRTMWVHIRPTEVSGRRLTRKQ